MKLKDYMDRWRWLRESCQLWKACRLYKEGVKEAREKHAKDRRRYYLVWDPAQQRLISLTYDRYEGRGDSYKYLVQRGRWKSRLTPGEMKEASFYYTPSRSKRAWLTEDEAEEKKREWLSFYMRLQRKRRGK